MTSTRTHQPPTEIVKKLVELEGDAVEIYLIHETMAVPTGLDDRSTYTTAETATTSFEARAKSASIEMGR